MSIKCDVLVVGAGVAGSTCTAILDKLGIENIYLIERSEEIGLSHSQKIDFAEDKGLKKILEKYNLPILKETNISRWFAPNQELFELKSKINDIWFKRGDKNSFETNILKKTEANIFCNTKVISISNGKITAIDQKNKKKIYFEPNFTVVATGNFHPYLNKNKKERILQNYYAKGYVLDDIDIDPDIPHIFFDKKSFQGSYLFMVQDSKEDIGYLAYASTSKTQLELDKIKKHKIIGKKISSSKITNQITGTIYFGKPCSLGHNNTLFVGDAANLMDPFLSYGVANSVKSGAFAAEAISNKKDVIEQYKRAITSKLFPEIKKQYKMRRFFEKLSNDDINCMIELLNYMNRNQDIEELFDNLGKLAIKITPFLLRNTKTLKLFLKGFRWLI
jgi:flavin-dependent dehydrogenase